MRAQEGWTQGELAEKLQTNQNAVHRLESPFYGKQTLSTLQKVAYAFDTAVVVRFVPFSQIVDWVTGTPFTDMGLSSESLAARSFEDDGLATRQAGFQDVLAEYGERVKDIGVGHASLTGALFSEAEEAFEAQPASGFLAGLNSGTTKIPAAGLMVNGITKKTLAA